MQRNSKRQRCDDRQRQEQRPASKEEGEGRRGHEREKAERGESRGMVAEVRDLVRVPLVAEDQGRKEDKRGEHCDSAQATSREKNPARGTSSCDEHPDAGEEVAQPPPLP